MTIFARIGALYEERRAAVVVAVIGLFHFVNNLVWLARDNMPPSWDQAAHADSCLTYFRLFGEPMRLSLTKLLSVSTYYPPLYYVSTVPWSFLFGFSPDVLAAAEIVFLLVLAFAVFKLGERLFSPAVGTGAAAFIALSPVVFGLSREILLDVPVIAMVALTQYAILETRAGTDRKASWLLGLALGLSVLIKWTAIVFVAGPFLVVFAGELKRRRPPAGKVLGSLAIVLLVTLIIALPWYAANGASIISGASHSLASDAVREGDPSALGRSLLWYWSSLERHLVSRPLGIFMLLGLAAFVPLARKKAGALAFLLAWALPAFLFFLILPNKDGRYIAPLLAAPTLLAAAGLDALRPPTVKRIAWGLLVLAGSVQFFVLSFGSPTGPKNAYARPPRSEDWKAGEILKFVADLRPDRPLRIAFLPDVAYFNFSTFRFTAHFEKRPFVVDPIGTGLGTIEALEGYDILISKSGRLAVPHTLKERAVFWEWFTAALKDRPRSGLPFRPRKSFLLPDRSKALLYERTDAK
jgi:4-amino-4-deoxy-L-arabinose transferase-like glycosyltransferase